MSLVSVKVCILNHCNGYISYSVSLFLNLFAGKLVSNEAGLEVRFEAVQYLLIKPHWGGSTSQLLLAKISLLESSRVPLIEYLLLLS